MVIFKAMVQAGKEVCLPTKVSPVKAININNLRYADDTTLMAESEEELNSLLVQVKEGRGKS